jgi:hypothetical protein
MPANKSFRFGPVALTAVLTTNILNCNVTSLAGPIGCVLTQPYLLLRHIRFVNKAAAAHTFSLWLGATGANAAGTEVIGQGKSVGANDVYDWYGYLRLDAADFLVGGADAGAVITVEGEGEIGISG